MQASTSAPSSRCWQQASSQRAFRQRRSLVVTAAQRSKSLNQVCCSKTLVAKPGSEAAVQRLCMDIVEFSTATAKDKASGIVVFECANDNWDANVFHFWERYENKLAMSAHNTNPRVIKFMEQALPHLEKPIGMVLYEYQNGRIGTMCVAEGPKGEGGLDDATGAHGTAAGASMKQTSSGLGISQLADDEDHDAAGQSAAELEFVARTARKLESDFKQAFKSMFSFGGKK